MTPEQITSTLDEIEQALERGADPDLKSFWRTVAAVKRDPALVDRFADRIGALDEQLFRRWAGTVFPPAVGSAVLWGGTGAGLALIAAGYSLDDPWNAFAMLAGMGALLGTTHGLAHEVVARAQGMRIVGWFLDGPTKLQPGMKVDYSTYLRVPPRRRAWMHAAGAIATKITPFVVWGAAAAAGVAGWAQALMVATGVVTVITDVVFSVKKSDWKRFRREMRIAREIEARRPA